MGEILGKYMICGKMGGTQHVWASYCTSVINHWQLPWPPDCCQYAHGHMHVKLQMRSCSQGQIHQQTAKHFSETSLVMFP